MLAQGEFAAKIQFLDSRVGYLLLGFGFFLATLAIILIGQGAGQRLSGGERILFGLGSLATYGFVIVYLGVGGGQIIAAIAASIALVAASLWILPPSEVTHDPIGAFVTPGSLAAGLTLVDMDRRSRGTAHLAVAGRAEPARQLARGLGARPVSYNRACLQPAPSPAAAHLAEWCPSWLKEHDWKSCRRG